VRVTQDAPVSRRAKSLARRIGAMGWTLYRVSKSGWKVEGPHVPGTDGTERLFTTTRLNVLSRWVRCREQERPG
jgi:hypothetical protein